MLLLLISYNLVIPNIVDFNVKLNKISKHESFIRNGGYVTFKRARSQEQIEQRKTALLKAAEVLLEKQGYDNVSLNMISKRAGITKASTYRYFESKEDIYLELLLKATSVWVTEIERELAPLAEKSDIKRIAEIFVDSSTRNPKYWNLMSVLQSILERNITLDNLKAKKKLMEEYFLRITNTLKAAIPQLSISKIQLFLQIYIYLIESSWHTAHPSQVMSQLLETQGYEVWKRNTEKDLSNAVFYLIKGMLSD